MVPIDGSPPEHRAGSLRGRAEASRQTGPDDPFYPAGYGDTGPDGYGFGPDNHASAVGPADSPAPPDSPARRRAPSRDERWADRPDRRGGRRVRPGREAVDDPDEPPARRRINGRRKDAVADGSAVRNRVRGQDRADGPRGRSGSPADLLTGLRFSDATVARLGAALLWVLVLLAAYGGVTTWLQPGSTGAAEADPPAPGEVPDGRWAAAGFAERYVAAYLAAGADGDLLRPYLGYAPDLPVSAQPAPDLPVRAVEVVRGHEDHTDYWSVTVAVGSPDFSAPPPAAREPTDETDDASGDDGAADTAPYLPGESFWQVSVVTADDQPVAVGLPAPVAAPPRPDRVPPAVNLRRPPVDEPMVDSVEGFLTSYLCGGTDLDRFVHPDYRQPSGGGQGGSAATGSDEPLAPAEPPVCDGVEVVGWGSERAASPAGTEEERHTVVAEVVLDADTTSHRATYGFTLAERDGRWEVAALLPAPPIRESDR